MNLISGNINCISVNIEAKTGEHVTATCSGERSELSVTSGEGELLYSETCFGPERGEATLAMFGALAEGGDDSVDLAGWVSGFVSGYARATR